ncbi:hypothetical protein NA57DRAFT_46487 [Rhizodiscina lignyota]|uniref:LIM zinc-binding domain-containing protein n=1 Tax=Rhizodiscina lignyota TaxID=1504668 RepID=A0A9P4IA77_9PEZI|nr:hypothetical protein NA57DRAFT_46487 [Rhizodiscina lignyota]
MENGMRWMERQEAHSLRRALEDMDLADDTRIHNAAQDEASELVWKHQNPDMPYRYRDHLRKGSYNRSHSLGESIFNSSRRRSSGSTKRKVSGTSVKGIFTDPNDKIYEEPEPISPNKKAMDPAPVKTSPLPSRRNPFARVQFARANSNATRNPASPPLEINRFDKIEIQKNPPSQSRNPLYTSNDLIPPFNPTPKLDPPEEEEIKMKDGKEVRGDDIRAATSMRMKDRSAKLPTPVLVSDTPGRPIVSFKEPKQIELKEEISKEPEPPAPLKIEKKATPTATPSPPIPAISVNSNPPPIPTIAVSNSPPVPVIAINDTPPVPTIAVNDTPPVPTIAIDSAPPAPSISINSAPSPIPTIAINDPAKPHWSPAAPISSRATALCTSCALPIAGRIVSAAGARFHPECFRCHHCAEALECVAFYPEPDAARAERIARMRARSAGQSSLRFYCHLDFHEFFSPRCRSCKTPIEGEVVLACGGTFHAGHFFCAQCGDPFDSRTPFVEKDGYAWCVGCHTNRFSTKCRKCRKPVVDTVVKALGAEWHEGCFVCAECGGGFRDGRYFLRQGDRGQDPYCVRCEERRLKA